MAKRKQFYRMYRKAVYERDGYVCQLCKRDFYYREDLLTLDHIIPLSKGGSNHINNLQTACFPCNVKKGDKIIGYTIGDVTLEQRIYQLKQQITDYENFKTKKRR